VQVSVATFEPIEALMSAMLSAGYAWARQSSGDRYPTRVDSDDRFPTRVDSDRYPTLVDGGLTATATRPWLTAATRPGLMQGATAKRPGAAATRRGLTEGCRPAGGRQHASS
jgi:hypothetical protein